MPAAPTGANGNLSANQQAFLSSFAATTGLDPTVAAAWLRNEEPNIQQNTDPVGHGAYNFLNIGITGSKNYGANSPFWNNPAAAGKASAEWMMGRRSIPGFGHSSSGIQAITRSAGRTPAEQIAAIQQSGWAAGGETALPGLYQQFSKQGGVTPTQAYRGAAATTGAPQTPNPSTGVPPKVAGVQPAANDGDMSRNALIQWGLAQATANHRTSAGPNLTGAPAVADPQGVQSMQADAPVPSLSSLFGSAQQATATGQPVTATTLTGKQGNPIAVQIDPGVNPNHTTAGAIKLAKQYLGTDYVFGGASPKTGFDCSGLISYVYGKMGVKIPHYTGDMLKMGQKIDPANTALKPGDAIFFNGGEHVGMYLGGGQFIQAPHTGDVVKISKLQGYDGGIYAVRRYA